MRFPSFMLYAAGLFLPIIRNPKAFRHSLYLALTVAWFLAAFPAMGQSPAKIPFAIEFDPNRDVSQEDRPDGKPGLHFKVKFTIIRHAGAANEPGKDYQVVVEEDGREVYRGEVPQPKLSEELSAVLAIDISGSMARDVQGNRENKKRIDQARIAAESFVKRLPTKAECGLILFDHEILEEDKVQPSQGRVWLLKKIEGMQPRGGTAYIDATETGVQMLRNLKTSKGRTKAVVVMTDGVDLNSKSKLPDVIALAKREPKVNVHTIGIGEPGTGKPVYSVLVLDHSKSMEEPASDLDQRPKIAALHKAASRFVSIMPESARTAILPFGSIVSAAGNFSNNKLDLISQIATLRPQGETAMLDAAYDAVATLEAAAPQGHRAVVVMTDGIDNMSRHRPDDVIRRAKEANVPLYMLAFGRESELRQAREDMERIATETGGSFHHASNEQDLIRIFEAMSNALHDDGIDVPSLTRLADETGGRYYAARDINKLKLILDQLSKDLQKKEYTIIFDSPRGQDGTVHNIKIKLVRTTGEVVAEQESDQVVQGVVIPEMNPFVYLGFLGILGALLVVPATLGRMLKSSS